jgi:uncharacterized protein (TIGR03083 family)
MTRDRWEHVAAQRRALAERVLGLDAASWDHPSRCEGWRIRDVLGHLVYLAEVPLRSRLLDGRDSARRDPAAEIGSRPVPELCERLVNAASSRCGGMPAVALSEVVAHGDDMLRPVGEVLAVAPEVAVAVLRQLRKVDRLAPRWAFGGRAHRGVRLVATDVAWVSGRGPRVDGAALDLIALLTNRTGAIDQLRGPGVPLLPEYAAAQLTLPGGAAAGPGDG